MNYFSMTEDQTMNCRLSRPSCEPLHHDGFMPLIQKCGRYIIRNLSFFNTHKAYSNQGEGTLNQQY